MEGITVFSSTGDYRNFGEGVSVCVLFDVLQRGETWIARRRAVFRQVSAQALTVEREKGDRSRSYNFGTHGSLSA